MLVQIIAEGPTDRQILMSLLNKIGDGSLEFVEESKTQMKRRGIHSILFNYTILAKFLHHGFYNSAEVIVICVDNDNEILDYSGVGSKRKQDLKELFDKFCIKNKHIYPNINPKLVLVVPVQTIDYWMKCVDERKNDCQKIKQIENINQNHIKVETYGKSNVYFGWLIDQKSIDSKIEKISHNSHVLDKLRCFPSFSDFEEQLKNAHMAF